LQAYTTQLQYSYFLTLTSSPALRGRRLRLAGAGGEAAEGVLRGGDVRHGHRGGVGGGGAVSRAALPVEARGRGRGGELRHGPLVELRHLPEEILRRDGRRPAGRRALGAPELPAVSLPNWMEHRRQVGLATVCLRCSEIHLPQLSDFQGSTKSNKINSVLQATIF
jgi:hypothetical protein